MAVGIGSILLGICKSLAPSVITGSAKGVYKYIQSNKAIDTLFREAFAKAVEEYFKHDELQQEKVIYHNASHNIELLRKELNGEPIDLESEKYKKLYEYFKEEVIRNQTLTNYIEVAKLDLLTELVQQNAAELREIHGAADTIQSKVTNIEEWIQTLSEHVQQQDAAKIKESETTYPKPTMLALPEHISMRSERIDYLCGELLTHQLIILYGTRQIGKSIAARLIAQRYPAHICECRNGYSTEELSKVIVDLGSKNLIILDNLPTEQMEPTLQVLSTCDTSKKFIITTNEAYNDALANFRMPSNIQYEIPCLSEDELAEVVASYKPEGEVQPIVSICANHHPMLVQILCRYLQSKEWKFDLSELERIVRREPLTELESTISAMLSEIPEQETQRMLNRLLLFISSFTEDEAIDLAEVEPCISQPRRHFQQLKGSWLTKDERFGYQVTSMLKSAWKPDITKAERVLCNNHLAEVILKKKKITEIEAIRAIMYYNNAELYDKAGGLYVHVLFSCKGRVPKESLLNLLWVNLDLPSEMSLVMRIAVRMSQVMQLKNASEDIQDSVYRDLMRIVDEEGFATPFARITYGLMASICFFKHDYHNGLRYYGMGNTLDVEKEEELPIPLAEDVEGYLQSSLWFLLVHVKEMGEFDNWLQTYQATQRDSRPMMMEDYEACYFFVWRYIDIHHPSQSFEENYASLDQLQAKSEAHQIDILTIMILFKKMDMYRTARKYEQLEELYNENIGRFGEYPLAVLVFNGSLGYGYYQEGKQEKREVALEFLSKSMTCVDEDMLPAVRVHIMEVMSYVQSESDKQLALRTMQAAYDYTQVPKHHIEPYNQYYAKGELVHAKWLAGDKMGAIRDMSKCIDFVMDEVLQDSPFAKSYICVCDCAIAKYVSETSGAELPEKYTLPQPGMYAETGGTSYTEAYSNVRIFITSYWMYTLCKQLGIADLQAKWLYKLIGYQQNEDLSANHYIVQTMYPELLKKGDLDKAIYVCKVARKSLELLKEEHVKVQNTDNLLYVLQLMPMILLAVRKIIKNRDYSLYERLGELIEGVDDSYAKGVAELKQLLATPIAEINDGLYQKYEGCMDYPLYQVVSTLLLMHEDTSVQYAFNTMCGIVQMFREHCNDYYSKEMNWVVDEFVKDYWEKKIASMPEAFEDMQLFWTKGKAQIESETDNKAKKYLQVLYYHIKDLDVPSQIEDWLME